MPCCRALWPWTVVFLVVTCFAWANEPDHVVMELKVRSRCTDARGEVQVVNTTVTLDPKKTAVVVVDMWDAMWCPTFAKRSEALVPRMNQALEAVRQSGIQIVFAPSDCMDFYKDVPQRKAMAAIPAAPLPAPLAFNPPEPPWAKTGNCECGPDQPCKPKCRIVWIRQNPRLRVADSDLIADCNNERELWNLCAQRGITHLLYMGAATNICLTHRELGILNMTRRGLKCYVVRDLTESFTGNGYDPDKEEIDPSFTPEKAREIVLAHLERYILPSLDSQQLIDLAGRGETGTHKQL